MDLTKITGETIYQYGTYIFIFWVATFLLRKMWALFEGKITNIDNNVTENKRLNKDISVIQAQTLSKLQEHDKRNAEAWGKMINGMDKLCDNLNGGNPAIVELQKEIRELKEGKK